MRTAHFCTVRQRTDGQWIARDAKGRIHHIGGRRRCKRIAKAVNATRGQFRESLDKAALFGQSQLGSKKTEGHVVPLSAFSTVSQNSMDKLKAVFGSL